MPDVSAPGGPPRRTCRRCGHEAATWAPGCPSCGRPYEAPRLSRRGKQAALVLALALTGGVAAYAAPRIDESRDEAAASDARLAAQREAVVRARVARDQRPVAGRLAVRADDPAQPRGRRVRRRRAMVTAFEAAIVRDAQARFEAGSGDGPVRAALCRPLLHTHGGPGDELDPSERIGRFECLAMTGEIRELGRRVANTGQPYVASLDFRTGRYVLCKYHPPPGEGGVLLAQVPLHHSCFGARSASELAELGIRESPRD